jgi:hypothetical protein
MPKPFEFADDGRYPQCGFSWPRRRVSVRSDVSRGGRPGARCAYVQRQRPADGAQRSGVSGLTGEPAQATRGSERLSAASSARSARVGLGSARNRFCHGATKPFGQFLFAERLRTFAT